MHLNNINSSAFGKITNPANMDRILGNIGNRISPLCNLKAKAIKIFMSIMTNGYNPMKNIEKLWSSVFKKEFQPPSAFLLPSSHIADDLKLLYLLFSTYR